MWDSFNVQLGKRSNCRMLLFYRAQGVGGQALPNAIVNMVSKIVFNVLQRGGGGKEGVKFLSEWRYIFDEQPLTLTKEKGARNFIF